MIKSRIAVASALLAVAGAAHAGFSFTPTLTTDYDFRGLTQSDKSEAVQLGLNFNLESGVYFGAWASNIEFPSSGFGGEADAKWELDFMAGYAGGDADEGFAYDIGAIMYSYPSSRDFKDIYEIYAGITKGWVNGKVWFAPDNYGDTSYYVEGNVNVPLPHGLTAGAHVGYSAGDYWKNSTGEYMDYSLGLTKSLGNFSVNLKYVNSNDHGDPVIGRNAIIGSVSTTFPWAD
jgi:uncharacterized protein (TIGR02001 family)